MPDFLRDLDEIVDLFQKQKSDPPMHTEPESSNSPGSPVAASCAQANDETEPNSRFEIQTTHGYYPSGRWGHAAWHSSRSKAIARCKEFSHSRVYDHEKEEVIFPTGEDE